MKMQIQLEYKNRPVANFRDLISRYPASEFYSPYRSTVPALAFWQGFEYRLSWLSELLGCSLGDSTTFCFEYGVEAQKGTGRPSRTDLMILSGSVSIAIEAKYTEPPYDTVRKWLGISVNRREVLEGWIGLIATRTENDSIRVNDILDLPYQLIHRCASACYPTTNTHYLLYQCFDLSQDKYDYYASHLRALYTVLNAPSNLEFYLLTVPLKSGARYRDLQNRWDSGERKLHEEVIAGLMGPDFIGFGKAEVAKID